MLSLMLFKVIMKKRCNKYYLLIMDFVFKKMIQKKYKYIFLRLEFKKKNLK